MRFVVRLTGDNNKYATFRIEAENREEAWDIAEKTVKKHDLAKAFSVDPKSMKVEELIHQA